MRFNMIGFVLGDIIARNRGVPPATAMRDGLLGGVVGSPMLGVVLASVISQNQESSVSGVSPSAPVVNAVVVSSTDVILYWSATANAVTYKVNRNTAGEQTETFSTSAIAFDDDSLDDSTTYSYSVDALDATGRIIVSSAAVQVTTPPG